MLRFVDIREDVVDALARAFADAAGEFEYCVGPFQDHVKDMDVMVSPANSFGIMDGGIDLDIRDYFGMPLQDRVQETISSSYLGEQPVGTCVMVKTEAEPEWLAHAPTMRFPMDVAETQNAYLAFRAILVTVPPAYNILCPGLCTATGRMRPDVMAQQMLAAWRSVRSPVRPPADWHSIQSYLVATSP